MILERPGYHRRLARLLGRTPALLVPFDDLLISGPTKALRDFPAIAATVAQSPVDGVLGFPGFFRRFGRELLGKAWVVNVTASTTLSQHVSKQLVLGVEEAAELDADAVAVHVNFSARRESRMLRNLAHVARDCRRMGIPLLAIAYVRREGTSGDDNYHALRQERPEEFAALVAHACHAAVELGADVIKTQYTGSPDSFRLVVDAVSPTPVLIAGGPKVDEESAFAAARGAIVAGAAGVCFGRNTFDRSDRAAFLASLRRLLDETSAAVADDAPAGI